MKHHTKRYFLRLLPWFWMLFIWSNSWKPASESSAQSMAVLGALDELIQLLPEVLAANAHHMIRKTAHAFEFAVLGALWYEALCTYRISGKKRTASAAVISLAVAVLDESIQLFMPGRSGQVSDVCLDTCGAVAAIFICTGIRYLGGKRKERVN